MKRIITGLVFSAVLLISLAECASANNKGSSAATAAAVTGNNSPYSEASYGTPVLKGNGVPDAIWETTEVITTENQISGTNGATASVRVMWDTKYLYVLAIVEDSVLDDTSKDIWLRDSIEVYVDERNTKASTYRVSDAFYRIGFNNQQSGMDGVNLHGVESTAVLTDSGYMIELKIPFRYSEPRIGRLIGFDLHVNDAEGGKRVAVTSWADKEGIAHENPSVFGIIKMVRKASNPGGPVVIGAGEKRQTVITVNFGDRHQVMEGISGNFAKNRMYETRITNPERKNDAIGEYTLKELNPKFVRVGIPLIDFKPTQGGPVFDSGHVHQNFLLMQDFTKDGRVIVGSIWDIPNWLLINPENTTWRRVKDDMYDTLAAEIAGFVQYADTQYGIKISYLSFNESEIGVNVRFNSAQYTDIIKRTSKKLKDMGYTIPWFAGDTGNAVDLVRHAKSQLEDPDCLPFIGAISYHSWDVNDINSSVLDEICALGKKYKLPIWVAEAGYDALMFTKPGMSEMIKSWEGALRLGTNYYKAITYSGASNIFYWQYQWDFELVDAGGNRYPAFYIMKQLNETLLPGMTVVGAECNNPGVLPIVSFSKNQVTVNLWNNAPNISGITIQNLPDGTYQIISSNDKNVYSTSDSVTVSGNTAQVELPGKSMVSLVYKANNIILP
ncbi:MAG: hypothetical protein FWF29_04740 [Treponema sp.]|nr:hypothetical protein [Treponema sp.]